MRLGSLVAATLLTLHLSSVASAQEYPTRPVRMLNPFAPGGPVDVLGRLVAGKLSEVWAQPVIVDNRPSAGGAVAGEFAKARPDGYTLSSIRADRHQ